MKLLLPLAFVMLAVSCIKEDTSDCPPSTVERVLVVYLAADNNLSGSAWSNLASITEAMKGSAADARTIVYIDTPGENPRLIDVTPSGQKELYCWNSPQNSASGETLREVITMVRQKAPANLYGLVLWSHGMAWVPSAASGYFTRSMGRNADQWPATKEEAPTVRPWPATKWFGQDVSSSPMEYIETADLAAAIPDGVFDYILFDACFMGSVEVLYALRKKADYIISSPAEVITEGFPYQAILPELLRPEPDMKRICRSYYDYYANHTQPTSRAATVSLVKTAELEALASATRVLYTAALAHDPAVFSSMDLSQLQHLDRYRRHFLFDMGSIVRHLNEKGLATQSAVDTWRTQLARTVIYEAHTGSFFDLPLDECCGLSSYVPVEMYADLNTYYRTLEWSETIYE